MENNPNKIWTILDIVNWGTDFFRKKGIDSPRLNIELLLCHLVGFDRIDIYLQYDKPLSKSELDKLRLMVLRRAEREPLQYITGRTNFYGLNFSVNKSVLIPRPETEILVNEVLNFIKEPDKEFMIIDIGTGCGNIAISLAMKLKNSRIIAVDNSGEALKTATTNTIQYGLKNIIFEKLDILTEIPNNRFFDYAQNDKIVKFDIIVSNPPYIKASDYYELQPEVLNYEPADALTDKHDGLTFYKRFAELFEQIMKPEGRFFLEIGFEQADAIQSIFTESGFTVNFIQDFNNITRVAVGHFIDT